MDDPFEKMKRKIKKATAFILGAYFGLFFWLISPIWFSNFIESLPTWGDIFVWIVPIILIAIASYFVIFDIHNWFEKKFFKERKKIGDFIRNKLTIPCREINCNRSNEGMLKEEEDKLMDLFYTFIPDNDTERLRAFHYWGDYFITVNLSMFSTISFAIATIYLIIHYFSQHLLKIFHPSFIIIFLFLILSHLARKKTKKKLIYPPQAQTTRILAQDRQALEENLPKYRIGCQMCCPLIHERDNSGEKEKN